MKLKRVTIAGFRGFNAERIIDFDETLTLVGAPNSHGKTSISEALEFLLFGETSKVEHADSKEEYRNSYLNRHYPTDQVAYIEAIMTDGSPADTSYRVELPFTGEVRRFVDGTPVVSWPFAQAGPAGVRPFVLQHALKYLLLVRPSERFQGFARILGLNAVDATRQAIVNLCTKPVATIPGEAQQLLATFDRIQAQFALYPATRKIAATLGQGPPAVDEAYRRLELRADRLIADNATGAPADRIAALMRVRDHATSQVYSGSVRIKGSNAEEKVQYPVDRSTLATGVSPEFLRQYGYLASRAYHPVLGRRPRDAVYWGCASACGEGEEAGHPAIP